MNNAKYYWHVNVTSSKGWFMKIREAGTCRGSGKVFTKVDITSIPDSSAIVISAKTSDARAIPCALYELEAHEPANRSFVAVVPMLDVPSCEVMLTETLAAGRPGESASFRINFLVAKWESRLNYKVNQHLCREIRDYDRVGTYDNAMIDFIDCIEDGDEAILRMVVYEPYRENNEIAITCTDATLNPIPLSLISLGGSEVTVPFSKSKQRRERQYSVRVPNTPQRLIFSIEDANHPSFTNFEVLDGPMFADLRLRTTSLMRSAQFDSSYDNWFKARRADIATLSKQDRIRFCFEPKFSIIVPLFKTPPSFFQEMVQSVIEQSYHNWELILVNASPDEKALADLVAQYVKKDTRIRTVSLTRNLGISENTNRGIEVAGGDFVCFFDHDDLLEPNILFEYAKAINAQDDTDLIYCDEDKLMPDGSYAQPFFKPDYNLDLLRGWNYVCHMLSIRKTLLDQLEPNTSAYDGAQDHNLTLRAIEKARHVHHVPMPLYHWRVSPNSTASNAGNKSYATDAGILAVKEHLERLGVDATVSQSRRPFSYKVVYNIPENHPLVSIIIPSKDHTEVLDTCITSILKKSTYDNFEIVIIENNSTEDATFEYYDELKKDNPGVIRVEHWEHEFNFSKLMNFGAQKARGDYLLLLNNDTEVITPDWIEIMLGICARKDVGIVGVRLLYPDNTIQHAGVCIGGACAGHLSKNLPRDVWGYYAMQDSQQDLSAVTAACLMTKRSSFETVDGFTETLSVAFNDIDYCLKVRALGQLVVYTPEAELYHHESLSRGAEVGESKRIRFHREVAYMNFHWAEYYVKGDPYFNPNFSHDEACLFNYHL